MESRTFASTVPRDAPSPVFIGPVATTDGNTEAINVTSESLAGLVDNGEIAAAAGARLDRSNFSSNKSTNFMEAGSSSADAKGDGTGKIKKYTHCSDTVESGFPKDFSTIMGVTLDGGHLGTYPSDSSSMPSRFCAEKSEAAPAESNFPVKNSAAGNFQPNNFNLPPDATLQRYGADCSDSKKSCIINSLDTNVGRNRHSNSISGLLAVLSNDASSIQSIVSQTAPAAAMERNNSKVETCNSFLMEEREISNASPTTKTPSMKTHEKYIDTVKKNRQSSKGLNHSARMSDLFAPAESDPQKDALYRIPRKAPKASKKAPKDLYKSSKQAAINRQTQQPPKIAKIAVETREKKKLKPSTVAANTSHAESADRIKSSAKVMIPSTNPVKEPFRRSSSRKRLFTSFYADEQAVDRVKSSSKRKGGKTKRNSDDEVTAKCDDSNESGGLGVGDGSGDFNNDQTFRRSDNEKSAIIENETNRNDCPGRTRMHEVYKRKRPVEEVSRNVTDSIEKNKIALLDFSDHGAGCKELEKLWGEGDQANHESSALGDEGIDEATVQCDDYDDPNCRRKGNKFAKRSKSRFGRADSSTGPTPKGADIDSMQQIQREPISKPPEADGEGDRKGSRKATCDSLAQERSTEERDEVSAYSATVETTSATECKRLTGRKIKSSRKTSETTSKKVQVGDYPLPKESRLRRKSCVTGVSVEAIGPGISASQAINAHSGTRFPTNKVSKILQLSPTRNSYASVNDDCISHSVKAVVQSTQCNGQLYTYAKDLPPAPRQGWQVYEEESAWRFYNPDFPKGASRRLNVSRTHHNIPHMVSFESDEELRPLPPPPPLPKFPETGHCTWSYNNDTRVVLANFHSETLHHDDQNFLLRMMERDDITVISEGLAGNLDQSLWTVGSISCRIGSDFHHKIRVFRKNRYKVGKEEFEQLVETKEWYKMRVSEYLRYLAMVCDNQMTRLDQNISSSTVSKLVMPQAKKQFVFHDCDGCKHTINDVNNEALYAVDLDLVKLLPWLHKDFERNFRLPDILPGGRYCMMDAVNPNGRPFMGPNLYMTPPGTYTHIHQDGHGTVDSGHFCLSGYNEVLMIRRIVERRKIHVVELLMGKELPAEDILYGLPHCDDQVSQWPTKDSIKKCEEMGYCPSVFILKPGQMVHINKGRLHAFRKMSSAQLPKTDCHCDLRDHILSSLQPSESLCCASIAWDWMYKGISPEGINREVSSILECARLNRSRRLQSLAIPETTLLYLAKNVIADFRGQKRDGDKSIILPKSARIYRNNCIPSSKKVLRGILPSLQFVVSKHSSASRSSKKCQLEEGGYDKLEIISKPNTHENPDVFALDPYGSSDFFCKICMEELSNVYLHCMGCEKLLGKDFNICVTCHSEGEYRDFFQMHPFDSKRRAELNHTGNMKKDNKARCKCKNGRLCTFCGYCTGCSCKCHRWFGLYYRFMSMQEERDLLSQAEEIVGSDEILHGTETKARLFSLIQGAKFDGQPTMQSCNVLSSFPGPHHDSDSTASPNFVRGSTEIEEATTAELSSRDVSLQNERSTAASIMGSECTTGNIKVAEGTLSLLNSTEPDQLHRWSKQASSLIQSDELDITETTSQTNKADETASKENINLRTAHRSIHPTREKTTITAAGNRHIGQILLRGGTIVDSKAASSPSESTIAVDIHPQKGYSTNNRIIDHGVQSSLDIHHGEPTLVIKSRGYEKKSEHNHKGEHENSPPKKNHGTAALSQLSMFEEEEKEARFDNAVQHQNDNWTTLIETSFTDCSCATGESFGASPAAVKAAIDDFDDGLSSCVQKPVVGSLATRQDERSTTKFNTTENGEETNFDALKYMASATCDESATTIRLVSNITHKNIDSSDDTPSENSIRGESFSMPNASNNSEDKSIFNNAGIDKCPPTQHIYGTVAISQLSEETGIDVVLENQQNILTPQNKPSFTGVVDASELPCSASTAVAKTAVGVVNDDQCTSVQVEPVMVSSAAGKNEETITKCKTSDEGEQPIMSESRDANPATCDKSATTIRHVSNITPKDIDASEVSPSGSSATIDRGEYSAETKPCKVDDESKIYDEDGSGESLPRKRIHETATLSQLHVSDNQHGDSTNSYETTLIDCVGAAESSFIASPAVAKTAVGDFGDGLCSSVQESVTGSSAPGKKGETTTKCKTTKNGEQPIMSASRDATSATCGESVITIRHVGNVTPKDIDASGSGSSATIVRGEYSTETKPCDKTKDEWKFNVVDGSDDDPSERIDSIALSQLSLEEVQEDNLGDMVHNHCDDSANPNETLFLKCENSTSISCIAGPASLDTAVGSSSGTASVPKAVENIIEESRFNHAECHNSPPVQHTYELTAILKPPEKASFDIVAQNQQDEISFTDCERATGKTCIASQAVSEAAIHACGYGRGNCVLVPGMGSLTSQNDDESTVRSNNNFSRLCRDEYVLRCDRVSPGALTRDKTDRVFRDKHLDSTFSSVTLSTSATRELDCAISRTTNNTVEFTSVNRHCRSRVSSSLQESDAYVEGEAIDDSNQISTNFQPVGVESKIVGQHQPQESNGKSELECTQREPSIDDNSRIPLTMKKDSQILNDDDSVVSYLSPDDLTVGSRVDIEFKSKLWQADVLSFDKTNRERLKIHFVGSKRSRSQWISFHQVKNLVCDEAKKQRNGKKQK